jgi:hypothetical protein
MTGTRAERMRQPLASDVIAATAEQHGVCIRPFTMEVGIWTPENFGTSRFLVAPQWNLCVVRVPARLVRYV